jgi:Sec-independent protein translocase protein TatA
MDILGIGGWELVAIIMIMLIVAGPKRMISWSYTLGKYVAQLRKMWSETAQVIQKEFDEAGVDVKVPKNIPTRGDLNREVARALTPVTKPFQESLDATKKEIDATKQAVSFKVEDKPADGEDAKPPADAAKPAASKPAPVTKPPVVPPASKPAPAALPKASTGETPAASSNGHSAPDFGTWSKPPKDDGA